MIAKNPVRRILVDGESSVDVLFCTAFIKMNLPLNQLKPISMPLVAFNWESIKVKEDITLLVIARTLSE